jgi:hypothetical protein
MLNLFAILINQEQKIHHVFLVGIYQKRIFFFLIIGRFRIRRHFGFSPILIFLAWQQKKIVIFK